MSVNFNADEAFAMGEQIERNGAAFYRRAAELAKDPHVAARLHQLAEWEGGHESLFSTLRQLLAEEERAAPTYDPQGEAALYLREMADRHVFRAHADPRTILTGNETLEQLLDIAIGFERDSIVFFQGIEAMVPMRLGRDKVHLLVEEEMGHVAVLAREKDNLKRRREGGR